MLRSNASSDSGTGAGASTAPRRRQKRSRYQRTLGPECGLQQRGEDRPDPDRREKDALEHSEHPRPHLVGGHPLEEGQPADVDEYVSDADDAEAK